MRTASFVAVAASTLALSAPGLLAQSVISAHSGVLNHYAGEVTIDGKAPQVKTGKFAEVGVNQELQTQIGRAELLLTPGVFLRAGENSAVRMDANKLSDTKITFLKGSAILNIVEVVKENSIAINYQDYSVTFLKSGIYRFDSEPAQLRVYTGEAVVTHGGSTIHLKDGRAVPFTPALVAEKFDNRNGDELYRWAKRRSEYIAVANLSAARRASNGYSSTGSSSWAYNPYYGLFTFIPGNGMICDPFSVFYGNRYSCYYSRSAAWRYYYPPVYNYGGGGGSSSPSYNSGGYYPNSGGYSSTMSTYSGNSATYSSAPSVAPSGGYSGGASSGGGFSSGGASSSGGGGFSGGGGGGGGASHGGGSAGGHGK
jgi:hypothetical protein